jgi:hypothetical protein
MRYKTAWADHIWAFKPSSKLSKIASKLFKIDVVTFRNLFHA